MKRAVLVSAASVLALGLACGAEDAAAQQELVISVEEAHELLLQPTGVAVDASPLEGRSICVQEGLEYSTNDGPTLGGRKITVHAEGTPPDWLTLWVAASEPESFAAQSNGEVALVQEGTTRDEADLIVDIADSGTLVVDLTYTVAQVPWEVASGSTAFVSVVFRVLES